jgi:hypothetical protein
MGDVINAYKILVRKPEGKRLLGTPRHGYEDDIKMILKKLVGKVSTGLIWGLVAGSCEHGNEPSGSIKGGGFLD